jgi:hypothetical protein
MGHRPRFKGLRFARLAAPLLFLVAYSKEIL